MTDTTQIITRIKRKADIMRMDAKAKGDLKTKGDANEIIAMVEMLERQMGEKE